MLFDRCLTGSAPGRQARELQSEMKEKRILELYREVAR